MDRLNRIEQVFKEIGITHSVYNRGLYYELIERNSDHHSHSLGDIYNLEDCKIPEKIKEFDNYVFTKQGEHKYNLVSKKII